MDLGERLELVRSRTRTQGELLRDVLARSRQLRRRSASLAGDARARAEAAQRLIRIELSEQDRPRR